MTRKLYDFKDHPEHREQLAPWAAKWIANAMSTKGMDEAEREICRQAVLGLYAAAKLPPPKHIVFVPSPFVLAFAGGFAASIWYGSRKGWPTRAATGDATGAATWAATGAATGDATWAATGDATWAATGDATGAATGDATWAATGAATRAATWDATRAATRAATGDATWAATGDATRAATGDATWAATWAATGDATGAATWDATRAATRAATWAATRAATGAATGDANLRNWYVVNADMRALAKQLGVDDFGLRCAANAWNMWHYGNQDSGYDAYLSFFQDIAQLPLDYSHYQHWRTLAEHSGPRIMHADFCMISDRPEALLVDDRNRPHCEDGPFCRWRDGTALYSVHGVRVPAWIVEHKDRITPVAIDKEGNAEVRRVMIDFYGAENYIKDSGAKVVHADLDQYDRPRRLLRKDVPGDEPIVVVEVTNATREPDDTLKKYMLRVDPNAYGGRAGRECHAAVASTWRRKGDFNQFVFETPEAYAPLVES